jgi:hypothetical protein
MQDLEQAIRERAYHLWIANGCRDGNADDHWLIAQREFLEASLGTFARVTVDDAQAMVKPKPKPKVKTASKTKGKRRAA